METQEPAKASIPGARFNADIIGIAMKPAPVGRPTPLSALVVGGAAGLGGRVGGGRVEAHGDGLGDAVLAHADAVERVGALDRAAIVGDDDVLGAGGGSSSTNLRMNLPPNASESPWARWASANFM